MKTPEERQKVAKEALTFIEKFFDRNTIEEAYIAYSRDEYQKIYSLISRIESYIFDLKLRLK